jgi:hypothetical protein
VSTIRPLGVTINPPIRVFHPGAHTTVNSVQKSTLFKYPARNKNVPRTNNLFGKNAQAAAAPWLFHRCEGWLSAVIDLFSRRRSRLPRQSYLGLGVFKSVHFNYRYGSSPNPIK